MLYFNDQHPSSGTSGAWADADNWWSAISPAYVAAGVAPGVTDDVTILTKVTDLGGNVTVNTAEFVGNDVGGFWGTLADTLNTLTVTNGIIISGYYTGQLVFVNTEIIANVIVSGTFDNSFVNYYYGTITGNVTASGTFDNSYINHHHGTITGNVVANGTFAGSRVNNNGTITGNVEASGTFDNSYINTDTITGNVTASGTFNNSNVNIFGTITGNLLTGGGTFTNCSGFTASSYAVLTGTFIDCTWGGSERVSGYLYLLENGSIAPNGPGGGVPGLTIVGPNKTDFDETLSQHIGGIIRYAITNGNLHLTS